MSRKLQTVKYEFFFSSVLVNQNFAKFSLQAFTSVIAYTPLLLKNQLPEHIHWPPFCLLEASPFRQWL